MEILPSSYFIRRVSKLARKNSILSQHINETLALLSKNPQHPSLRLHKLTGKQSQAWSVSVDRSIRIVFRYISEGILLTDIGSHDEVY